MRAFRLGLFNHSLPISSGSQVMVCIFVVLSIMLEHSGQGLGFDASDCLELICECGDE